MLVRNNWEIKLNQMTIFTIASKSMRYLTGNV